MTASPASRAAPLARDLICVIPTAVDDWAEVTR
jgi:hypothetical protein